MNHKQIVNKSKRKEVILKKKYRLIRLVRLVFVLFAAATLIGGLYLSLRRRQWAISWLWSGFTSFLALLLTYVPDYLKYRDVMMAPASFQVAFSLFIFLSMFLGNLMDFYHRIPWWDTMLHFSSGFLLSLAGLILLVSLIREPDLLRQIHPAVFFLFSLVFSLACGAVWEIFEFYGDALMGMNMQRWQSDLTPQQWAAIKDVSHRSNPGLMDTMKDLTAGSVGALLASFLALPVIHRVSAHSASQLTSSDLEDQLVQSLRLADQARAKKASPVSQSGPGLGGPEVIMEQKQKEEASHDRP